MLKLFIDEQGSDEMVRFSSTQDDCKKVLSALARIEARSAITRLRREGKITTSQASIAIDSLGRDVKQMIEQPVSTPVLEVASKMIDLHFLRAMDAAQLGCAVVARDLLAAPDMRFITSDNDLLDAAQAEGFEVWNPASREPDRARS